MKIVLKSVFLMAALISTEAFANASGVKDSVYEEVAQQAKKLGYFGYDVTVCLNSNNQLRVGGVSFWNAPLKIFLVNADGAITATKRISPLEEVSHPKFKVGGAELELSLDQHMTGGHMLIEQKASLSFSSSETVEQLTCFTRLSGLE